MSDQKAVDDPAEIMDMRRRHVRLAMLAQEIALAALLEMKARLAAGQLNLTYEEAERLRGAGAKLEREALGGDNSPEKRN